MCSTVMQVREIYYWLFFLVSPNDKPLAAIGQTGTKMQKEKDTSPYFIKEMVEKAEPI